MTSPALRRPSGLRPLARPDGRCPKTTAVCTEAADALLQTLPRIHWPRPASTNAGRNRPGPPHGLRPRAAKVRTQVTPLPLQVPATTPLGWSLPSSQPLGSCDPGPGWDSAPAAKLLPKLLLLWSRLIPMRNETRPAPGWPRRSSAAAYMDPAEASLTPPRSPQPHFSLHAERALHPTTSCFCWPRLSEASPNGPHCVIWPIFANITCPPSPKRSWPNWSRWPAAASTPSMRPCAGSTKARRCRRNPDETPNATSPRPRQPEKTAGTIP